MAEPAATAEPDGREVRLARAEDLADPQLAPYTTLTDAALRRRVDAEHGVFLAESSQVVRRALAAGHTPRSFLLGDRYRESFADVLAAHPDVPLFTGPDEVLTSLTGFHLHRGALAAMDRPAPRPLADVLAGARRVLIAEDLVDHTNLDGSKPPQTGDLSSDTSRPWQPKVAKSEFDDTFALNPGVSSGEERRRTVVPSASPAGRGDRSASNTKHRSRIAIFENIVDHSNLGAAFRSAAAIGVDAVLVTPSCADPLYRRSIRVSMGTVFQVPWARIDSWPADIDLIKEHGYVVAGMMLGEGAITLDELVAEDHPHLALVFGTEGHGLTRQADRRLDRRVTIPMMHGVDSLNVSASAAVAFYATR